MGIPSLDLIRSVVEDVTANGPGFPDEAVLDVTLPDLGCLGALDRLIVVTRLARLCGVGVPIHLADDPGTTIREILNHIVLSTCSRSAETWIVPDWRNNS